MAENEQRLEELLTQWEQVRAAGKQPSLSSLCRESPELQSELRRRTQVIAEMEARLGASLGGKNSPIISQHSAGHPVDSSDGQSARQAPIKTSRDQTTDVSSPRLAIPGYEIEQVLDRGGMGVVYLARQNQLERRVALKMMHEFHLSQRRIARFRTETGAIAKLQHPNVVQIFEIGELDGRPWFSMEFVPGGSLRDFMADRTLDHRETAEFVLALAIAVHATHEHGIVHRDLKPSNILLTSTGKPKLADFGLAKHLDADSENTRTGEIIGTPNYMAPEQAEGAVDQIGPAVDVYAVGTILFEMLVGDPPFQSPSPLESLRRVSQEEANFPSDLRSSIPRDLQLICLKCLQKKPSDRYGNAALLADDLERFLTGRPIVAEPTGVIRRIGKWIRRRPDLATLSALSLVLLLALAFVAGEIYRSDQISRDTAAELAPQAYEILKRNCAECHGQQAGSAVIAYGLNILDHDSLLTSDRSIIIPGVPEDSRLIQRIADGSMPPEENEVHYPRVAERELRILTSWIAGGAPPFPPEDPNAPIPPVVPFSALAEQVRETFHTHCYSCHKFDVAKGGIKILNHRLLLSVRKVVIPGLPEESELFRCITADENSPAAMPPLGKDRVSPQEIETIRQWIIEGAPPFPKSQLRRPVEK